MRRLVYSTLAVRMGASPKLYQKACTCISGMLGLIIELKMGASWASLAGSMERGAKERAVPLSSGSVESRSLPPREYCGAERIQ